MHRLLALILLLTPLTAETIDAFGLKWDVPLSKDWSLESGILRMLVARPSEKPRRPTQFALAQTKPFSKVTVEADVKRDKSSLILVYAWRGPDHFNYVHLSTDTALKANYHNGVFHVFGGDRVRISSTEGPAALGPIEWTHVKLVYDAKTGEAIAWVNGVTSPSLRGIDLSLSAGRVGIGSFFETAQFRNVKIAGE
jgi:hypothetical protein